jgi:transcriptional regulator with XRE-family HTH domain
MSQLSANIARAIIAQRSEQGVSQSELARRLNCTPGNIWRLESDYRGCCPTVNTLARIAKVLRCSVWVLLLRAETKQF